MWQTFASNVIILFNPELKIIWWMEWVSFFIDLTFLEKIPLINPTNYATTRNNINLKFPFQYLLKNHVFLTQLISISKHKTLQKGVIFIHVIPKTSHIAGIVWFIEKQFRQLRNTKHLRRERKKTWNLNKTLLAHPV